jgi:hypothetical protein
LEKTEGADGKQRKRPAKKKTKTPEPKPSTTHRHATGSAEVSIEQRRAENAALDDPGKTGIERERAEFLILVALRVVAGLSRNETERFFATLRNRLDDTERKALRDAAD